MIGAAGRSMGRRSLAATGPLPSRGRPSGSITRPSSPSPTGTAKGLPVAYVPFEGEQHGFRRAENIKRALEAELYFYSRVFGFPLADPVESVNIHNL
jgi:hypothetical protein